MLHFQINTLKTHTENKIKAKPSSLAIYIGTRCLCVAKFPTLIFLSSVNEQN